MRWLMLGVLFTARLVMGYQFQSVGSVSAQLIEHFSFSYGQIGELVGLFLLPGIVMAIPSGALTRATSDKNLLMVGAGVMAVGAVIMASAEASSQLYVGRLITGVGGVLFNLILTKMVTDWFVGREIITGLSIMLVAWPIGIALGLLTQGPLAQSSGWAGVMFACGAGALLALVLVAAAYRAPPKATGTDAPQAVRYVLPLRQASHISVLGVAWGVYNLCWILPPVFGPDVLVAHGWTTTAAQSAASTMMWAGLLSLPLGGRLIERFGHVTLSLAVFLLLAAACLVLLAFGVTPVSMFVLLGLIIGIPGGALLSLTSQAVTAANRGPGLGVFYTWYYVLMTLGPMLAGWLRDVSGDAAAPLLLATALMVVAVLCVLLFRLLQRWWPIAVTA